MIYLDFVKRLDELRSKVRAEEGFKKPRNIMPPEYYAESLRDLADELEKGEGVKVVTLELDANGKPIIPADMSDLFATVPEQPKTDPNKSAGVIRRNPVIKGSQAAEQPKADDGKPKAVMLPRETPRIEHPIDLEDADESTVAK